VENGMVGYGRASQITGIAMSTLYSYVSRRQIPHYRLGKRLVVFAVPELQAWLKERRVAVADGTRL
jgi:predicted DNA-binding transcriptional regulator AlpA